MRRLSYIVIALLVLLATIFKTVVLVNYVLNRTIITEKYCENKARPAMHCNGKCHLNKQIQDSEKKESSLPNGPKIEIETSCTLIQSHFLFISSGLFLAQLKSAHNAVIPDPIQNSIFHPPC